MYRVGCSRCAEVPDEYQNSAAPRGRYYKPLISKVSERSAAWLAHQSGGLGVGSSNLPAPTIDKTLKNQIIGFFPRDLSIGALCTLDVGLDTYSTHGSGAWERSQGPLLEWAPLCTQLFAAGGETWFDQFIGFDPYIDSFG